MLTQLMLAADEAGGGHAQVLDLYNWLPGVTALVVFGLAFLILWIKVWPQITKGLDEREAKIRQEIQGAEEARARANEALAEYEQSLTEAREEARQTIAKARDDAKALGADLKSRNEAELSAMKERAAGDIDAAKKNAIAELHAEAATLAAAMAGKILQREISAQDQQALVEESLRELGRFQDA